MKTEREIEREIGFKKGLRKALSLLRKKRIEIERHRRKCKVWNNMDSTGNFPTYCYDCCLGSISKVIEPLQLRLEYEKNKKEK
jgi:hypothetical protein